MHKHFDEELMLRLYRDERLTVAEVASRLGVSTGLVATRLKARGGARSKSEALKLARKQKNWGRAPTEETKMKISTSQSVGWARRLEFAPALAKAIERAGFPASAEGDRVVVPDKGIVVARLSQSASARAPEIAAEYLGRKLTLVAVQMRRGRLSQGRLDRVAGSLAGMNFPGPTHGCHFVPEPGAAAVKEVARGEEE